MNERMNEERLGRLRLRSLYDVFALGLGLRLSLGLGHIQLVDLLGHCPAPHELPPLLALDRVPEPDSLGHHDVPLAAPHDVTPHREPCLVAPAGQLDLVVLTD